MNPLTPTERDPSRDDRRRGDQARAVVCFGRPARNARHTNSRVRVQARTAHSACAHHRGLLKLADEQMERLARKQREQLQLAAAEAHTALVERRQLCGNADVVAECGECAEDMCDFQPTGDSTETRAFIRTFVREITVRPGRAMIRDTIPTPQDSQIGRSDTAQVGVNEGVISAVGAAAQTWTADDPRQGCVNRPDPYRPAGRFAPPRLPPPASS